MWASYFFRIEIELIVEPLAVRRPLVRCVYYEKLAASLRSQGAAAAADKLDSEHRKHPEPYGKWWITKDGSLGYPEHPLTNITLSPPSTSNSVHLLT